MSVLVHSQSLRLFAAVLVTIGTKSKVIRLNPVQRLKILTQPFDNAQCFRSRRGTLIVALATVSLLLLLPLLTFKAQAATDTQTLARWVQQMKTSPKGPFARVRWFCRDGTVLPPEPFACEKHGGGIQHGEWNEQARVLRSAGFHVANVLAALAPEVFTHSPQGREELKQILLERFLISVDDGWIFRGARYYRGALQEEDEAAARHRLLLFLAGRTDGRDRDFLLFREAARWLPHGEETTAVREVRQLSTMLGERDAGFESLRNKIHSQPDASDARRVRIYAANRGKGNLLPDYERLAAEIDLLYRPGYISNHLAALAYVLPRGSGIAQQVKRGAEILAAHLDPETRFHTSSELLMLLRDRYMTLNNPWHRLEAINASLVLEREFFTAGTAIRERLPSESRRQRLLLLEKSGMALYGSGLISVRQWQAMQGSFNRLDTKTVSLAAYREELRYLSRVLSWGERWYQFHFAQSIEHLAQIEPLVWRFIPEQLRASPLLMYSAILDSLITDADRQAGINHELFGQAAGVGLRMLNPGLARGVLRLPSPGQDSGKLDPDGIYLLPATTAELPPVAGILTLGEGNAVSHVQILARNLGIPNVAVDQRLVSRIQAFANKPVVLAVTPGGRVLLKEDGPQWDAVFGYEKALGDDLIRLNPDKLDLETRNLLTLDQLRAVDAGRIAGPKAANLGELRYHFHQAVPNGVVIPFGVFRDLLNQRMDLYGDKTVLEWMQGRYRFIRSLEGDHRQRATQVFLTQLRDRITKADPGHAFRQGLRQTLWRLFGEEGTYSLFVRSDTNVEDLPGFTGAGLNLTVPGVVGFDNLLEAISQVWASPFTERAFAWRQARMEQPEHVYASILLMRSVPVEKSGVMVTVDIDTGDEAWVTVAVNEGIGGAVQGQAAEELKIDIRSGASHLLAEATAPTRRVLTRTGGLQKIPVSGNSAVLNRNEINQLLAVARELPSRFPMKDDEGMPAPADVEFGFYGEKLVLFQVRPYLHSQRAKKSAFLNEMDQGMEKTAGRMIALDDVPKE